MNLKIFTHFLLLITHYFLNYLEIIIKIILNIHNNKF